jgi:hypothetical protein
VRVPTEESSDDAGIQSHVDRKSDVLVYGGSKATVTVLRVGGHLARAVEALTMGRPCGLAA